MFTNVLAFIIALGDPGGVDSLSVPGSEPPSVSPAVAGIHDRPLAWVFADESLAPIPAPNLGEAAARDVVFNLPVSRRARTKQAKSVRKGRAADLRHAVADVRGRLRPDSSRGPVPTVVINLDANPARANPALVTDRARGFVRIGGSDAGDTLWREDDGLFYVSARINGAIIRLIVDTGASFTVLSAEDARRVGFDPGQITFAESADTAAGATPMARIVLANLEIGRNVAAGVPAMVASGPLRTSLLGQNVLTRLGSVTIEGDRMTLR